MQIERLNADAWLKTLRAQGDQGWGQKFPASQHRSGPVFSAFLKRYRPKETGSFGHPEISPAREGFQAMIGNGSDMHYGMIWASMDM